MEDFSPPAADIAAAPPAPDAAAAAAELTVIIISYNTRELTLKCLETLYANTRSTRFRTVLLDNQSTDGSADAVAAAFPQVELIRSEENLGFARGNNVVAAAADTEWLLLLNPDTEVHEGAIDNLLAFSRAHPEAGLTGGRTVFPDGSLNSLSCGGRITPWSSVCFALGLTALFRNSPLFNSEQYGGWKRDSVREVDMIVGCFLMIRRDLWNRLGGFNLKYYMYGEDADLAARAAKLGYRPMMTPEAVIMHLVGASAPKRKHKYVQVGQARATWVRDHWPAWKVPFGIAMLWLWSGLRYAASRIPGVSSEEGRDRWAHVWAHRKDWLKGYPDPAA